MTRHVCGICGYSLDDGEITGQLSSLLSLHMRLNHCPTPMYHYDPEADEYVYRLMVPTGTDISQDSKEEGR